MSILSRIQSQHKVKGMTFKQLKNLGDDAQSDVKTRRANLARVYMCVRMCMGVRDHALHSISWQIHLILTCEMDMLKISSVMKL